MHSVNSVRAMSISWPMLIVVVFLSADAPEAWAGPADEAQHGYTPGRTAYFDPRATGYTLFAGKLGNSTPPVTQPKKRTRAQAKKRATASNVAPSVKLWSSSIPLTGKAIALADDVLFVAGTPVVFPKGDLAKAYEGRMGGILWAASATTGDKLGQYTLDEPPAWDGLAAARGMLFVTLADGHLICMGPR